MRLLVCLFFACAWGLQAEVRTLTLRETVDLAVRQNPDLAMSRLDEQKGWLDVRAARDPFVPKVVVGSGAAYSNGFPMSIEGSAPTVFRAQAVGTVFDRAQTYRIAQAKENARGAQLETAARREDVALRAANLFLDAERAARNLDLARKQLINLEKVAEEVALQVKEGRALEVDLKRARFNLAAHRHRILSLEAEMEMAETALAVLLGFGASDRVRPAAQDRLVPLVPETEEAAVRGALETNRDLRRLHSALAARNLDAKASRAERLPVVDLVAQYGLFAKYNNYEDFFNRFQRHNGQLGVSVRVPITPSQSAAARAAQSDIEVTRLRIEIQKTRDQISQTARRFFFEVKRAESAVEVARLDLEVAREQVSVLLARMEEGKVTLRQLEEARYAENEKWQVWVDSRYALERAKYALLKETGDLVAALR